MTTLSSKLARKYNKMMREYKYSQCRSKRKFIQKRKLPIKPDQSRWRLHRMQLFIRKLRAVETDYN